MYNLNSYLKIICGVIVLSLCTSHITGQERMTKKYRTLKVELQIDAPAAVVWNALVKDYGNIGNFSPYIYSAHYENGSLQGEIGAERKCYFSKNEKRWAHEIILDINEEKMEMVNTIKDARKFPLDKDNTQAIYRVRDNGDGTSTAGYEFQYRAKPAFMGGLMKGRFKKLLGGTLEGLKHYVETGEIVNATNERYEEIKDQYEYKVIK